MTRWCVNIEKRIIYQLAFLVRRERLTTGKAIDRLPFESELVFFFYPRNVFAIHQHVYHSYLARTATLVEGQEGGQLLFNKAVLRKSKSELLI